jgi:hypothetical protein
MLIEMHVQLGNCLRCEPASFNHLVNAVEDCERDRKPEFLGGLEIDDQVEFCRLFDRKIGWLRAFKDAVDLDTLGRRGLSSRQRGGPPISRRRTSRYDGNTILRI